MITRLYTFYDTQFDHDVCHLFEHVLLRSFLRVLTEKNYNRTFFGWLRGRTVDSTLFFDLGAYSEEVVTLFDNHINTFNGFDEQIVNESIAHIEAETECIVEIINKPLLMQQFAQLSNIVKNTDVKVTPLNSPLKVTHSPELFDEFAVLINVFSTSEEIKKSFFSLHPAIIDAVRDAAIDNEAVYPAGRSAIAFNDDGLGVAYRFRVKKDLNIKSLESITNDYIHNYQFDKIKEIDKYRTYFERDPANNTELIDMYEQTGIRLTIDELSESITKERLMELVSHSTIRFSHITNKLKNIDWDY